jgi:hypothetical protein
MSRHDDHTGEAQTGEALREVARIHPLVDRLRDLLSSATFLDMKASSRGYWAPRSGEGERASTSP